MNEPEPKPVPNASKPIYELVIHDIEERARIGREKYGTHLQAFNGRRPLQDAYQEAMDLTQYLRQAIEENDWLSKRGQKFVDACNAAIDAIADSNYRYAMDSLKEALEYKP